MTSLLPTVQSANGAMDDETLGRVICAIKGVEFNYVHNLGGALQVWSDADRWTADGPNPSMRLYPAYARPDQSIDAALALVRERWPDILLSVVEISEDWKTYSFRFMENDGDENGAFVWEAEAKTLPLAILAAALDAASKSLEPGGER